MPTIYDTTELVGVIDLAYKPKTFLTNVFFPTVKVFDAQSITFDIKRGGRRLAPFVSPCVEGRPVRRNGFETKTFSPAYVKPKMALVPCNTVTRRAGEQINGQYSMAQRRDLQVQDDLMTMVDMVDNRIEWMAAQALVNGFVDVVGDDYPLVRVDFQRPLTNQTILAGANLWSAPTSTPVSNMRNWSTVVASGMGGSVTDIVMGANVWAMLANHQEFNQLYKYTQNVGGSLPSIVPSVMDDEMKVYHGQLGQWRLWSYNATYTDLNGVTQFFVPPNDVLLIARQEMQGLRAFGAIMDHDSLQATPYFPSQWPQRDPSVIYTSVQSAPLAIPQNVNSVFRATVL